MVKLFSYDMLNLGKSLRLVLQYYSSGINKVHNTEEPGFFLFHKISQIYFLCNICKIFKFSISLLSSASCRCCCFIVFSDDVPPSGCFSRIFHLAVVVAVSVSSLALALALASLFRQRRRRLLNVGGVSLLSSFSAPSCRCRSLIAVVGVVAVLLLSLAASLLVAASVGFCALLPLSAPAYRHCRWRLLDVGGVLVLSSLLASCGFRCRQRLVIFVGGGVAAFYEKLII